MAVRRVTLGTTWSAIVVAISAAIVVALFWVQSASGRPVPLGQTQRFGNWELRVDSVDWNPSSWTLGMKPPPSGARNIAVTMTVQYFGSGHAVPAFRYVAEGAQHARYGNPKTIVRVMLMWGDGVPAQFMLAFTVAKNDLGRLKLDVYHGSSQTPVQFVLGRR
jgi:hypothetical protein